MIYFDNSSTTLVKPKTVSNAVKYAIDNFSNAGRSFNDNAFNSARCIYNARCEIAKLINLANPLNIAFTSNATESLNLVINSLIDDKDHVIITEYDHNASIRPLYNIGCEIDIVEFDGKLSNDKLENLILSNTKAFICTHASNVTGEIVDTEVIKSFCKKHGILFILDVSQTIGSIEVDASMADILCFTGHKSLFGPQGTGGIVVNDNVKFNRVCKSGGTGINTFDKLQLLQMPDIFEVGTINAHSINGLLHGVKFINETTIEKIHQHKKELVDYFYNEIKSIDGIKIYGSMENNVGIVALNYLDVDSNVIAKELYDMAKIITRPSNHCAPLIHKKFQTQKQGIVRFSFSYFNTFEELDICIEKLRDIIEKYKGSK